MKSIQSQIQNHIALCAGVSMAGVAFLSLPILENVRISVAGATGLSSGLLWLPISILVVGIFALAYWRLNKLIARPMAELAYHIRKEGANPFYIRRRPKSSEESALKTFVQNYEALYSEVEEERDSLAQKLSQSDREKEDAVQQRERQAAEVSELNESMKKLRTHAQGLAANNDVLQQTLENERKLKVGKEVKMRAEEIYSQVERAVSEASARSIWIPRLISKIESPTNLINDISRRLESSWQDLSIVRLEEEIAEIRKQSDIQLSLLEKVSEDELIPNGSAFEEVERPNGRAAETVPDFPGDMLIGAPEEAEARSNEPDSQESDADDGASVAAEAVPVAENVIQEVQEAPAQADPIPEPAAQDTPENIEENQPPKPRLAEKKNTRSEERQSAPAERQNGSPPNPKVEPEIIPAEAGTPERSDPSPEPKVEEEAGTVIATPPQTEPVIEVEEVEVVPQEPTEGSQQNGSPQIIDVETTNGQRATESSESPDPISVEPTSKNGSSPVEENSATEPPTALQALVVELVDDYAHETDQVTVDAEFSERIDIAVDEELLESVLSNLLEIGIYQWKEGSVKLRVSSKENQITFAVDSKGKPLDYGEMDESQANRIASALDRKIDVDMPSENELRMRYRYTYEEA